jgi:hypothetical protein
METPDNAVSAPDVLSRLYDLRFSDNWFPMTFDPVFFQRFTNVTGLHECVNGGGMCPRRFGALMHEAKAWPAKGRGLATALKRIGFSPDDASEIASTSVKIGSWAGDDGEGNRHQVNWINLQRPRIADGNSDTARVQGMMNGTQPRFRLTSLNRRGQRNANGASSAVVLVSPEQQAAQQDAGQLAKRKEMENSRERRAVELNKKRFDSAVQEASETQIRVEREEFSRKSSRCMWAGTDVGLRAHGHRCPVEDQTRVSPIPDLWRV